MFVPPPGVIVATEEKSVNTLAWWQSTAALVTHERRLCKHAVQKVIHRDLCTAQSKVYLCIGNVFFNPAGHVLLYSILYYYTALVQPLFVCSRSVKSILVIMSPVTDAASSAPPHTHPHTSFLAVIFSSVCLAPFAYAFVQSSLAAKMEASGFGPFNTGCRMVIFTSPVIGVTEPCCWWQNHA